MLDIFDDKIFSIFDDLEFCREQVLLKFIKFTVIVQRSIFE